MRTVPGAPRLLPGRTDTPWAVSRSTRSRSSGASTRTKFAWEGTTTYPASLQQPHQCGPVHQGVLAHRLAVGRVAQRRERGRLGGGADGEGRPDLAQRRDHVGGRDQVADAQPGEPVDLGEGAQHRGPAAAASGMAVAAAGSSVKSM